MKIIWIGYFIEILILNFIQPYVLDFNRVAIIAVFLHVIYSMLVLYLFKQEIKYILLLGYLIRLLFLFWDLYANNIFVLPHSGADTEMFYRNALLISNNLSLLDTTRGGRYSDIIGVLFSIVGPQRVFGQYLNVLLGVSVIFVLYKTLNILGISTEMRKVLLLIASFFPSSIIFSAVMLREMFPTFFVAVSLYYFVKWYQCSSYKYILSSFIFLGFASTFHSGVIGISLGYIFAFLFYKPKIKKFQFSINTIFSFLFLLLISIMAFVYLEKYLFGKFIKVEDIDDIYQIASSGGLGGSPYLVGIEINNFLEFILYIPLKSIYFLISPMPWNWRGIFDILSFFFDSMLYLLASYKFIKYIKDSNNFEPLSIVLFLMIIGAIFIFGVGVSNSGTAMRHRQKLLPVFLVLIGIVNEHSKKLHISV